MNSCLIWNSTVDRPCRDALLYNSYVFACAYLRVICVRYVKANIALVCSICLDSKMPTESQINSLNSGATEPGGGGGVKVCDRRSFEKRSVAGCDFRLILESMFICWFLKNLWLVCKSLKYQFVYNANIDNHVKFYAFW